MAQRRFYRTVMGEGRFSYCTVMVQESDLWIGYAPHTVDSQALIKEAARVLRRCRSEILCYPDPAFLTSFAPLIPQEKSVSPFLERMLNSSFLSGTGPMASVAGALAQEVGTQLKEKFSLEEIVVENGGDLFVDVLKPLTIAVFAGKNPLSGKIGLVVGPEHCPLGVCTSSATVGHSYSFGAADAVVVACHDAALSDGYATAFCNKVHSEADVEVVADEMNTIGQILSALVLLDTKLALCGQLEVRSLS